MLKMKKLSVLIVLLFSCFSQANDESFCPLGSNPNPAVIFCDSFETQGSSSEQLDSSRYFDFDDDDGDFNRTSSEAAHGQHSARVLWQAGEVSAGALHVNFGRSPLTSVNRSSDDFREIYWRFYVKFPSNFQDYPDKLSRLTIIAASNWAQAMIAHVWANSSLREFLQIDPVSGIENNQLATTKWNDFSNFSWLGAVNSDSTFPKGEWVCVESRVKLNDQGTTNGVFQLFTNGELTASKSNIDWVGDWDDYGLNAVLWSNYWNGDGSPVEQSRYLDALVVSTQPIGCIDSVKPMPPTEVEVN